MEEVWQRIEAWLRQNSPEIAADLLPGATSDDLAQLEQQLRCQFPADFKASYHIHNGTRGGGPPLMGEWRLLSTSAILREWNIQAELLEDGVFEDEDCEPDDPIQPVWWDKKWIPFASNSSGDFICLDLNPLTEGTSGQIISYWHTDPNRELLSESFANWLGQFAEALASNQYEVDSQGWLVEQTQS